MIALLVAVLCSGLGDEWVMENIDSLPPYGIPLKSDRAEYEVKAEEVDSNGTAHRRFGLRGNRQRLNRTTLLPNIYYHKDALLQYSRDHTHSIYSFSSSPHSSQET
jgi:hypothetical protein